jgi:hypothetical protein
VGMDRRVLSPSPTPVQAIKTTMTLPMDRILKLYNLFSGG